MAILEKMKRILKKTEIERIKIKEKIKISAEQLDNVS